MDSKWLNHWCKNKGLKKSYKQLKSLPKNVEEYLHKNFKMKKGKIYRGYSFKSMSMLKKWLKDEIGTDNIKSGHTAKINIKTISSWSWYEIWAIIYSQKNKYGAIVSIKPKKKDIIGEPCKQNDEEEVILYPGIYNCKIEYGENK